MNTKIDKSVTLYHGSNIDVLRTFDENSVDAVVTDPPYGLSNHTAADVTNALTAWINGNEYLVKKKGFMGKTWDSFVPGPELWREVYRVLKPGGHVLCFAGSRTDDLMGIALRLAGFEVRDKVMWIYGSGFPKSQNVSKFIDKQLGVEGEYGEPKSTAHAGWIQRGAMRGDDNEEGWQRPWMDDPEQVDKNARQYIGGSPEAQKWDGWGTALKPAFEPIIVARKPLIGTVADNVLKHGTGALNIDACRVGTEGSRTNSSAPRAERNGFIKGFVSGTDTIVRDQGRWPANVIHDGSEEATQHFPVTGPGAFPSSRGAGGISTSGHAGQTGLEARSTDSGSAARYFYCAKASKADRAGSKHPTVKPLALMRYLTRLVTPPGGTVLDPFAGSGTTGQAAVEEGFSAVLIEREDAYVADIQARFAAITANDAGTKLEMKTAA